MLDRAVSNLLSNALRYTPVGETISVTIHETERTVTLSVENPGGTIKPEHLDAYFPEFRPYLGDCRFGHGCSHIHEPGCAISEAVDAGEIPEARYESYRALRTEEG